MLRKLFDNLQKLKKKSVLTTSRILLISILLLLISTKSVISSVSLQPIGPGLENLPQPDKSLIHVYYFYSVDCPHCMAILDEIIQPLLIEKGDMVDIRLLELGKSKNYEALLLIEQYFKISAEERGLPTLIIGETVLIGELPIRDKFLDLVQLGIDQGGIEFPEIAGIDPSSLESSLISSSSGETCSIESDTCEISSPIHAAYFYQVGCQECSRANLDLKYLQSTYPQLIITEFNIYDQAPLANWLAEKSGRLEELKVPALFIGEKAWIGEEEITPQLLAPFLESIETTGSQAVWLAYDTEQATESLIDKFKSIGWVTVILAGLIDGLNPCAFATIVFFISYLTISGRKGKQVLFVGVAFTLGVFFAYFAIGLGLYKIFDLIGDSLAIVGKVVYGLTALICLVLGILSIRDYFKARKGDIGDMTLNLPESLRKRINATIRKGRNTSAYILGAFFTGIFISFLELACTGQIYLPTIIFMSSLPGYRSRAIGFLGLYNLFFILPLVVVFILTFFGTTSKDLTKFLKEKAAAVKLGMAIIFLALAIWLLVSLF